MYQHGRRTRQPKNMTLFLATIVIAGVVFLIGWFIVHKDIASKTGPKTSVPIVTEVGKEGEQDLKEFNEAYFSIKLPSDWEFVDSVSSKAANFYTYKSTKKGANDRSLTIHVDTMPASYKVVKMQPIISNGSQITLGNLSDDCINFGSNHTGSNAPFEAKWENVTFMCDPIKANQTIGTGTAGAGIASQIGNRKYFFYFEDHNIRPDSNIFRSALQTFRAK